jgi:triosephosphate isomerase
MIFLNFKTYESGTGDTALAMSKIAEAVSLASGVKVIPVVQTADIREIVSNVSVEVWAQKIDPVTFGAHTGSILPESVLEDGARGTFLNHSENRFGDLETLSKAHDRAREVGLKTLIFAKDIEELEMIASLKPDFISYEPPSLIGSKDKSVASAEPEIIAKAVEISRKSGVPLIVGAGVHSKEDVRTCIELGSVGIAVASDVMMADNPKQELLDLISGFTN